MSNDTTQLPPLALAEVCRTWLIGAKKHGDAWRTRNSEEKWRKANGHLWAFDEDGERFDKEDGQHHLAAAIINLMTLLEKDLEAEGATGLELDERKYEQSLIEEADTYPEEDSNEQDKS